VPFVVLTEEYFADEPWPEDLTVEDLGPIVTADSGLQTATLDELLAMDCDPAVGALRVGGPLHAPRMEGDEVLPFFALLFAKPVLLTVGGGLMVVAYRVAPWVVNAGPQLRQAGAALLTRAVLPATAAIAAIRTVDVYVDPVGIFQRYLTVTQTLDHAVEIPAFTETGLRTQALAASTADGVERYTEVLPAATAIDQERCRSHCLDNIDPDRLDADSLIGDEGDLGDLCESVCSHRTCGDLEEEWFEWSPGFGAPSYRYLILEELLSLLCRVSGLLQ
jgi:hypothetical protein